MNSQHLQELRSEILQQIVELGDYIADSDATSYDVLLALARSTGEQRFLDMALRKITAIEDKGQRSDALFELLDQVEVTIANEPQPEAAEDAPDEPAAPVQDAPAEQ